MPLFAGKEYSLNAVASTKSYTVPTADSQPTMKRKKHWWKQSVKTGKFLTARTC